jgi:hypothetical protein
MLDRLHSLKDVLTAMMGVGWDRAFLKSQPAAKAAAVAAAETIKSNLFWRRSSALIGLLTPVVLLLREVDGAAPTMGKLYYHCNNVAAHIRSGYEFKSKDQIWENRRAEILVVFEAR